VFFALERQDVEDGVEPADGEFVASVVEEDARCAGQKSVLPGLDAYGEVWFSPLVQAPDSF
jgi:hypothetical protein